MNGRELAARLAIHRPAIKVLYVSGTSDGAIARHRMLEPGIEFLEKPFSLESLLRKVRQVLGARAIRGSELVDTTLAGLIGAFRPRRWPPPRPASACWPCSSSSCC